MAETVIPTLTDRDRARFRSDLVAGDHTLADDPALSEDALAALLDSHDRSYIGVYTMGDDPCARETFVRGELGDHSGTVLMDMVKRGRIWLNVRRVERAGPTYAALTGRIEAALHAISPNTQMRQWHHKLLISSPNAQVFYHLDPMDIVLFQIRGEKHVFTYPNRPPFACPQDIEAIILQQQEEEIPYDPVFESEATVAPLSPGQFLSWPQYTPHRVQNGPMLNVSISTEYFTQESRVRSGGMFTHGLARRHLGLSPKTIERLSALDYVKWAAAKPLRALKAHKPVVDDYTPQFRLDPSAPACVARVGADTHPH